MPRKIYKIGLGVRGRGRSLAPALRPDPNRRVWCPPEGVTRVRAKRDSVLAGGGLARICVGACDPQIVGTGRTIQPRRAPGGKIFFGEIALDLDDCVASLGDLPDWRQSPETQSAPPGLTCSESKRRRFFAVELEAHVGHVARRFY